MTHPASEPRSEDDVFAALDGYLDALHRGSADKTVLLTTHPDLAGAIDAIEALDRLAVGAVGAGDPTVDRNLDSGIKIEVEESGITSWLEVYGPEFGKYELIQEIGRGGMGVVFKARQKDLDRIVALKMILSSHLASDETIRRFHAEARLAGGLHHPHVISIYEVGKVHEQHYFAMEYVEGESLSQLLREGRLDAETAAECLAAVARAVHHLHTHDVIHRDLKPSNILVDEKGDPHVTDFGLAKIFSSDSALTQSGAIMGTPSYMSPEQAAGKSAEVSPKSDVYSLGAILYEMLTGKPPFRERSVYDTLVQVLEAEPVLPHTINPKTPPEIEQICLRAIEKEPDARYASAAEFADDLERFLRGEQVEARAGGAWDKLRRWTKREPALASRLGGIGLFLAVDLMNFAISYDWDFHRRILVICGLWGMVCFLFQRLLSDERHGRRIPYAWGAIDIYCLTAILLVADGVKSPTVVAYLLLIAASGLWSRARLVTFMAAISSLSYGFLIYDCTWRRPHLAVEFYFHLMFLSAIAVMGFIIAYQVHRVRTLSRYFERHKVV